MVAYTYRMPAGIPGAVSRAAAQATIEAQQIDSAAPPNSYGVPVKLVADKIRPIANGDAATAIYAILVRPFPTQSGTDPLGTSTPPTSGICDVLKRGYINVKNNFGVPAKNGTVFVRVANGTAGKPIGGIEAAADGANTVIMAGAYFTGAADANGNAEIAFNI